MCGIFGQLKLQRGKSASLDLIVQMAKCLAHRGPDGYGTYASANHQLAFGAGRLAIIDLNAGVMPLYSEDRQTVVVYNGEIYNHKTLRRELEKDGHAFTTYTDTETIVHGYEQWGVNVIDRLRGMFAIGIWDEKRGRLVLARDRAGEKPLYYTQLDDELLFASEIKAILLHPQVKRAVNPDALLHYLALGYAPAPLTMFEGIHKLGAGERLIVENGKVTRETYWEPHATPNRNDIPYDEAVRKLQGSLIEAVDMRLMSDVPIGAFLSGGVDSTAIVALMARSLGRPVETFTVGFDFSDDATNNAKFNVDQRYGALSANALHTHHHEITIQRGDQLTAIFPKLVAAMDEPIAEQAIVQTAYVAALARANGVPVLLTGDSADELFLGYNHYRADQVLAGYLMLPRWMRTGLLDPLLKVSGREPAVKLAEKSTHDESPVRRYLAWMRVTGVDDLNTLMTDTTLAARAEGLVSASLAGLLAEPQTPHFADRIAYASFRRWIPENSNMRVDKMTMLMSTEARAPFEDHPLVDYAFSLPLDYKLRNGDFKRILKDAMRGMVPDEVLARPKIGFAPPMSDWLRGPLRPLVERYLSADYVRQVGYFQPEVVTRLVNEHLEKRAYHLWTIFPLLVFHLWYAIYIDQSLTLGEPLTPADLVAAEQVG
jgi:asparagine synthase (glutamine-hydrolysing)